MFYHSVTKRGIVVSTVGSFQFSHLQYNNPLTEHFLKKWSRDVTGEISRSSGLWCRDRETSRERILATSPSLHRATQP